MNLFYAHFNDLISRTIVIKGQEAKHISNVLRYSTGDTIHITNGQGTLYICTIDHISKEQVSAIVDEEIVEERPRPLVTLCMGLIKKRDRLEFAVEKATELGVDRIIIYKGKHSQKENVREDRLENTVLSAMKQSLRLFKPEVYTVSSLEKALHLAVQPSKVIVADETEKRDRNDHIGKVESYFLIVGPEGGFSADERMVLKDYNAEAYTLGEKRLRTETAAVAMVDRFKNLN